MRRRFKVVVDGEVYEVEVEIREGSSDLEMLLQALRTGVVRRVSTEASPEEMVAGAVQAPITGKVVSVEVHAGEAVKRGDLLVVLEAMKTRVEVRAPKDGRVKEVLVNKGSVVKQGQPLLVLL